MATQAKAEKKQEGECNHSSKQDYLYLVLTMRQGEQHGLSSCDMEHGHVQKMEGVMFPADRFQDVPQLYLWSYPFLSAGILCLDHALGPGSDIPSTVISITLKDQLA